MENKKCLRREIRVHHNQNIDEIKMRRLTIELKDGKFVFRQYHNGHTMLITEVSKSFFDRAMAMAGFISMSIYTLPEWQERNDEPEPFSETNKTSEEPCQPTSWTSEITFWPAGS